MQVCEIQEGEIIEKKVEAFNIRLDKRHGKASFYTDETKYSEELTIPFCLPDKMLPTLIQKDQRAMLSYHVKVRRTLLVKRLIIGDSLSIQSLNGRVASYAKFAFHLIPGRVLFGQKARVNDKSATYHRPVGEPDCQMNLAKPS